MTVKAVSPQWLDQPQAVLDAEMIRSAFLEKFNFPRENTHTLINPSAAQIDHAFGKIAAKCKNQHRKTAVFYFLLGHMEMKDKANTQLHQLLLCEEDPGSKFFVTFRADQVIGELAKRFPHSLHFALFKDYDRAE